MAITGRTTRGRQRVAMERMEKDSNRLVTFTKRRKGVFKKLSELCTLCGVHALCIVFSAANKVFAFGHPSVEAIMNLFLAEDNNLPPDNRVSFETFQNENLLQSTIEVSFLKDQLDAEKKRGEELLKERTLKSEDAQKFLAPAETFTYAELKQIQATLIMLRNNVCTHAQNLNMSLNPNPNIVLGQNYNPSPTLVQSHTTPSFGDPSLMTMAQPPLTRNPNDNIPMARIPTPMNALNGSNFMNTGFNHPNIPQAVEGPANLIPGSFLGQNTIPGQTFTGLLMGEGSSNFPAPPFNPQSRYMGSNPIPGDYQTFQNLLMGDGTLNSSARPSNPQGGYMGSNPIPGDYETFRTLMEEGRSNPSYPSFNPQGGGFGPGFDPGMN